jgi:hypothetical protein
LASIFRYPLEAPTPGSDNSPFGEGATEAIDYVCFQRSRTSYNDSGYRGFSFPSSAGTAKRVPDDKRVYIAMPKTLQTGFSPRYQQIDLGVMGAAMLSAMGTDLSGDMNDLARIIGETADAALPELQSGALAGVTSGLAQTAGLAGGLTASGIQALTKGRIFNPFKEQVFAGLDFRTHNFTFKLLSRSETEAQRVREIIDYFKTGALPSIGATKNAVNTKGKSQDIDNALAGLNSQRFFNVPETFDIKFIRLAPDGTTSKISDEDADFMHFKIHPSVCTGIQVNYTPDGQYTSFKSIKGGMVQVPAIQLGLTFAELKLVTQGDIKDGF